MLHILTAQLIRECDNCIARFWQMREEDREPDFFREVKPHADKWHANLNDWQQLATQYVLAYCPKYMHTMQIDNAKDAFEQFVVQSFYKGTSKKRFEQAVLSTKYTLQAFLTAMEEGAHADEEKDR